jgi:hypothetical protein
MSSKSVLVAASVLALLLLTNIGSAEHAPPPRKGSWPIRNGQNYQPTQRELNDLHREDVTSEEARAIDRLYDELMLNTKKLRKPNPASKP